MGARQNRLIEAVLTSTHNICFEQKYENTQNDSTEIIIFEAVKNRCILHGRVLVMVSIFSEVILLENDVIYSGWG